MKQALSVKTLTGIITRELGYTRANMPANGGFVVSQVLWDMVPVYLVHWAYKGDNMRERDLTDEVRAMRDTLRSRGYLTQTHRNLFFVLPDEYASLADPTEY